MGLVVAVGGLGAVSGYAAGALILDSAGWPWAFYLNVPIAAVSLAVVLAVIPADRHGLRPPTADMMTEALTLLVGAGALLSSLSLAASRGPGWLTLSLVSLVAGLVWARGASGRTAITRLRVPAVRRPHVSLLLESGAFGGAIFALPFMLETYLSGSTRSMGLTLLALPISAIVGSAAAGVIADRHNARTPAVLGAVLLAAGLASLAPADASWGPVDFLWRVLLAGVGAGSFASANQTLAMAAAAPGGAASMAASTNVARQLGFALGPAVVTATWAFRDYSVSGLGLGVAVAAFASAGAALALRGRRSSLESTGPIDAPIIEEGRNKTR